LIRRQRLRCLDLRQHPLDVLAALRPAEYLAAHRLHHVFGEHAANHRHLGAARQIVEPVERRLRRAAEERLTGGVAEAARDDGGDARASVLHRRARVVFSRQRDLQVPVALQPRDDRPRDRAAVVVDDGNRDPRRLGVARGSREHRTEE